jgi:hypothetical protein
MELSLIDFKIQIIRQGGLCIAYSHALDIATTGKSEKQAVSTFNDLVHVFTHDIIRTEKERPGSLDFKLIELGWTKRAKRWSPPQLAKV